MQTIPAHRAPWLDLRPAWKSFHALTLMVRKYFEAYPMMGYFMAVLLMVCLVYHTSGRAVSVYVDDQPFLEACSFSRTVGEALEELGVQVDPRDSVTPGLSTVLLRHTRIDIDRAFPVVLIADHKIAIIWTSAVTVERFLEQEGYTLDPDDRVEPDHQEVLHYMSEVTVIRAKRAYSSEQRQIIANAVAWLSRPLDRRFSQLLFEGGLGDLAEEHGERIIEYDADEMKKGAVLNFGQVMTMTVTSYCPGTPGSGCPIINDQGHAFCTHSENDGYTYTGKFAVQGDGSLSSPHMVAVDPKVIPLGSLLYIETIPGIGRIGFARAEDIGGAIKGNKIDLLYDRHSDVSRFGIKFGVRVYVLTGY